jgi:hypothetical protein
MARKNKTENTPPREAESGGEHSAPGEQSPEQVVAPVDGESIDQVVTTQAAEDSVAPGREQPAQGAGDRYVFTWTEPNSGAATGHDSPHVAFAARCRGARVMCRGQVWEPQA